MLVLLEQTDLAHTKCHFGSDYPFTLPLKVNRQGYSVSLVFSDTGKNPTMLE